MTKARLVSLILAGAVGAAALAIVAAAPVSAGPRLTPQEQLDKALAGRVAGKPVDCINPRLNTETKIIDRTAIIYGSGRTVYLQRPNGANWLNDDDVLVTELRGSGDLCSIDLVRLHDRNGLWSRGSVTLNQFVPYTRVAARD